jgi:hypothetical protein
MRISRMISCAALAALLMTSATPTPAAAQIGGFLKRKLKAKVVQTVVGNAATATGNGARTTASAPAPGFTDNVLEITPELLDRLEKGLAAELSVQDEIDRLLGKLLPMDEYRQCSQAVMKSAEAQKIYMAASDLTSGDTTLGHLQKASEELARRFDQIVRPKCGLDSQDAQQVRDQHADRLHAAGPTASGLTMLQLSILKERIIPFCTAAQIPAAAAGEVRITTSSAVSWVYTTAEMQALQPRCAKLASALQRGG